MSPLVYGLAFALCLLLAFRGLALVRSTPEGAQRLLGLDGAQRRRRRSPYTGLRAALGRRFGRSVLALMNARRKAFIRHRIDAAGRPGGLTLEGYAATKAASTVIFALLGLVLVALTGSPLFVLAFALIGWLQVDLSLAAQARRRQAQIDRDLPDFLDVLVVTVNAGLGFRDALGRVADSLGGPLGQECRIALAQMGYGAARRAAFVGIRDRSDSEALSQFMTALLQAEELGAPLGESLNAIADDMRKAFGQRARRNAARAVPRISIVVVLIVMPGVVILLLAAFYVAAGADYGALLGGG